MPKIVRFDGMVSLIQACKNGPSRQEGYNSSEKLEDGLYHWSGTATLSDAYKLAENGWQSEALKVSVISNPIIAKLTSLIERPYIVYDVEGIQVDIATYLNGEPECWQRWESTIQQGTGTKHIRIVFNSMISCETSESVIKTKGAAIAALTEALEYAGNRVQIDCALGYGAWEAYVTVKNYDQPLDLPKIVYALAHRSMPRRLFFRLMEVQPEYNDIIGSGYGGNHGKGYNWRSDCSEKGDVYINCSYLYDAHWQTPEKAQAWVLETLKQQGVLIRA